MEINMGVMSANRSATTEIAVKELQIKISSGQVPMILDVREPWEFEESRIEGAVNIPLHTILDHLDRLGDRNGEMVVYCRTGARGRTACAVLRQNGFTGQKNLTGGIKAFLESN